VTTHEEPTPDVSICMVALNCRGVLENCLASLRASDPSVTREVIVIDNGSTDGTAEWLRRAYPAVRLVENGRNVGFTRGTNQSIRLSQGRYILWLNTDTILRADTLRRLVAFFDAEPRAGIVGPKVLNPDGSFQPQCKRGLPTPAASLFYMLGLHRRWPASHTAGQYLLTYLPEDQPARVEAVSGCCLMARREVWTEIGPLDEAIFAFGEDIDWCVRANRAGWDVWYNPAAQIVHLKGQGGVHSKPYAKARGMHQGMWVFYRKHLIDRYAAPVTGLVWLGIAISFALSCAAITLRQARQALTMLRRRFPRPLAPA
jgi:GT2 family glycosyltransferase